MIQPHSRVLITALLAALVAFGCDESETRDAAKTAGEAFRTAAENVGNAMERTGQTLQNATDNPTTRPAE